MASSLAAKLIQGHMRFRYKGQGCTESHHLPDPGGPNSIETAAAVYAQLCQYRAALLPSGVELFQAQVSYAGKPRDSCQVLGSVLFGLSGGSPSAPKFDPPNDPELTATFRLQTDEGQASSLYVRGLADAEITDWKFANAPGGVVVIPASPPPPGTFSTSTTGLFLKYLQACLILTVYGKVNPGSTAFPVNPATPYLVNNWRRGFFDKLGNRKWGRVYQAEKGHK